MTGLHRRSAHVSARDSGSINRSIVEHAQGHLPQKEPLAFLRELRDCLQATHDTRPESLALPVEASIELGVLTRENGDQQDALIAYQGSLAIYQKLADANPTVTEFCRRLADSHFMLGGVLFGTGKLAEAPGADLRRALELSAKVSSLELGVRFERARALALLAELSKDAKSGVTAAEAASFFDQAVATLRDAITAGWLQSDELKEPDFDALSSRDDFKKLVAELDKELEPKQEIKPPMSSIPQKGAIDLLEAFGRLIDLQTAAI
jgi:hypothetical protein